MSLRALLMFIVKKIKIIICEIGISHKKILFFVAIVINYMKTRLNKKSQEMCIASVDNHDNID